MRSALTRGSFVRHWTYMTILILILSPLCIFDSIPSAHAESRYNVLKDENPCQTLAKLNELSIQHNWKRYISVEGEVLCAVPSSSVDANSGSQINTVGGTCRLPTLQNPVSIQRSGRFYVSTTGSVFCTKKATVRFCVALQFYPADPWNGGAVISPKCATITDAVPNTHYYLETSQLCTNFNSNQFNTVSYESYGSQYYNTSQTVYISCGW
jgi:hypothetical protein